MTKYLSRNHATNFLRTLEFKRGNFTNHAEKLKKKIKHLTATMTGDKTKIEAKNKLEFEIIRESGNIHDKSGSWLNRFVRIPQTTVRLFSIKN